MNLIYKLGVKNNYTSLLLISPITLIFSILLSNFFNAGKNIKINELNSTMAISQEDSMELKRDEFFMSNKDEYGLDKSKVINGYVNLKSNDTTINPIISNNNEPINTNIGINTTNDKFRESLNRNNQIIEELNKSEIENSKKSRQYKTYNYTTEEEIIANREEKKLAKVQPVENKKEIEKKVGFNTIKSDITDKASSILNEVNEKYKIESAIDQKLFNGSKATFKLKTAVGDLEKGAIIYGKVIISSNKINIEFIGTQFNKLGKLYLFQGDYQGIDIQATNTNSIKSDINMESRRQGTQIASDIVSAIPIIGNASSRIISRIGNNTSSSNKIEYELQKGEKFYIATFKE